MLGMVFTSHGFAPGSVGYEVLNTVAALAIVGSTLTFLVLLVFEVRGAGCHCRGRARRAMLSLS